MSNLTNEEMARMMRPGLRVIRGTDWFTAGSLFENEDENGPGTVIGKFGPPHDYWSYLAKFFGGVPEPEYKNVWKVKWDNVVESEGSWNFYWMGCSETGENIYRLKIIEIPPPPPKKTPILGNKLFMAKNTFDLKIICEGKILECHKSVLCCRSDVFDTMFSNESEMIEAQSREVKINDIQADTMETFLYFLYHDQVKDAKEIDAKLLRAAHKYNVPELMEVCTEYLKKNLSFENATDVLVSSHLTDQKNLFEIASDFINENKGKVVKTIAWEEFKKTNPTMAIDIISSVLKL